MNLEPVFISFIDKEVADKMQSSGFNYITQKFNGNQTMYTFELNERFIKSFEEAFGKDKRKEIVYVTSNLLNFTGGQLNG